MGQLLALLMLQYSRLYDISSNLDKDPSVWEIGSECTVRKSSKEGQRPESTGE